MRYGMLWQGSKSRIAEWVIDCLPASHTLVDLFAGGCAVTHAALLSGKFERIIANDLTDSVKVFFAAINGEFEGYSMCASREEFERYREEDTALALLNSFGNDRTTYLWGEEFEAIKRPASLMLSSPSIWERRQWYRKFVAALKGFLSGGSDNRWNELEGLQRLEGLERLQGLLGLEGLQRLEGLERLQGLQGLEGLQGDYRIVDIPEGATVYADPPYRGTANSARYGAFDFDAFDQWLAGVDFPVFVSEYDAPSGCVEVASTERTVSMSATATGTATERLFVQERFADSVIIGHPKLFDWPGDA